MRYKPISAQPRHCAIAVSYFHAKIHHRSNKPEVTPTILELIKIGIAHLETTEDIEDETVEELKKAITKWQASPDRLP